MEKKHSLFSIIIPTLNEEAFLPHLLESLQKQTEKNFEIIIVDGGSTDKTSSIVKTYKEKLPLTIIESPVANVSVQRNKGTEFATADWFIFVDADSVFLPYTMSRITDFISLHKTIEFFTTWFKPDSENINDSMTVLLGNLLIEGGLYFHRPVAPGPLTIVSKRVYQLVNGYDEHVAWGEDYDFTKRIRQFDIPLYILRETLYIISLRRLRREGTLKMVRIYSRAIMSVLVSNKAPTSVSGYIMGGQIYKHKKTHKPIQSSVFRKYESRLKQLMKDLFF